MLGAGRVTAIADALVDAGVVWRRCWAEKRLAGTWVALIGQQSGATATFVGLGGNSIAIDADTAVVNATSLDATKPEANCR